jgi:CRISPR-associated protein Cas1
LRYLNTVYVRNHRARVKSQRGALLVASPDGYQRIPLEAVDAVVLLGGGQITTQALEACVRRGVRVAALRQGGSVRFVVGQPTGGNVHLRMALYRAVNDEQLSLDLSKTIVAAKLQNSRKVVARWARDAKDPALADQMASRSRDILARVARLSRARTPNHIRGVEGDAARIYFGAVRQVLSKCELQFSGRQRRPPRDPVNAMLGFCYGLMLTEFIGAIEAVGLDYQMGFFHRPRSGRPSLALDLAEELRPLTDRFVVSLIRRRQVGSESFVEMPGGAVYLSDDGRKELIKEWERHKESELQHMVLGRRVSRWALPSIQATLLARHLRGDLPAYPPFVMT